jgi:rhodanese-related sulfurtransferase
MNRRTAHLLLVALTALLVVGCQGSASSDGVDSTAAYTDITPQQMVELTRERDYLIVNVHVPFEGEIHGTDLHIPFEEVDRHLASLDPAKDGGLLVYCRTGRMSRIAIDRLAQLGYTNMLHLDGGMNEWEAAGYALDRTPPGR